MDIGMVLIFAVGALLLLILVSQFIKQPQTTFGDETYVPTRTTASSDERVYPFPGTPNYHGPADEYPNPAGDLAEPMEEVYDPNVQR